MESIGEEASTYMVKQQFGLDEINKSPILTRISVTRLGDVLNVMIRDLLTKVAQKDLWGI